MFSCEICKGFKNIFLQNTSDGCFWITKSVLQTGGYVLSWGFPHASEYPNAYKRTSTQVFFCEILKNTSLQNTFDNCLWITKSVWSVQVNWWLCFIWGIPPCFWTSKTKWICLSLINWFLSIFDLWPWRSSCDLLYSNHYEGNKLRLR